MPCPPLSRTQGTLQQVRDQKHKLDAAGIEVVVISADKEEVARQLAAELQLPADLEVGYGLTEEHMSQLGVFISSPTHYSE
jgi:peroxiredoxin